MFNDYYVFFSYYCSNGAAEFFKKWLLLLSDDEFGERSVSVYSDGVESELVFIDHTHGEMSVSKLF